MRFGRRHYHPAELVYLVPLLLVVVSAAMVGWAIAGFCYVVILASRRVLDWATLEDLKPPQTTGGS